MRRKYEMFITSVFEFVAQLHTGCGVNTRCSASQSYILLVNSTLAMWRKYEMFSISISDFVSQLHTDYVAQVRDVQHINLRFRCSPPHWQCGESTRCSASQSKISLLTSTMTMWRKYEKFSISIFEFVAQSLNWLCGESTRCSASQSNISLLTSTMIMWRSISILDFCCSPPH